LPSFSGQLGFHFGSAEFLAACSLKDVHLIFSKEIPDEKTELKYSRLHTLAWGIFSIGVAMFATQMGSLIEAVNVLGSLFYGPILGIFLWHFTIKKLPARMYLLLQFYQKLRLLPCISSISFLFFGLM
jgi:zinc transporter ZupT